AYMGSAFTICCPKRMDAYHPKILIQLLSDLLTLTLKSYIDFFFVTRCMCSYLHDWVRGRPRRLLAYN
ncbi:hypothetical protein L9F63_010293, partial [Diploptera punctata]